METLVLTTLFSGYNYGSSLQTFATKLIVEDMGYKCKLVSRKTLVKGREIRFGKLFTILLRTLFTANSKILKAYGSSYKKSLIEDSPKRFSDFEKIYLEPSRYSWLELKKIALKSKACIAGSDQLWDPTTLYVDPLYYLRFVCSDKRISFSTSLGHDFIAKYNEKKIKKWISEFRCLSVREDSGVKLIKELCGREALHLLDPTLLLNGDVWRSKLSIDHSDSKYILAYFLDSPSEKARECLNQLRNTLKCEVIAIPYVHGDMSYATRTIPSGPLDFLRLVDNAEVVVTDSFHGTAFSINLHTPFFVFNRNYGAAHSQGSRVLSLLKKLDLTSRYEVILSEDISIDMDFTLSEGILNSEREKAKKYLREAIESCG